MPVVLADRVFETSTTTGTGTLNLAGAPTGFETFVVGAGDGSQVPYVIDDGTDWEVGLGTVTAGSPDTLSRDTIFESTNSDAAVNWGSGTRNVRLSVPAAIMPNLRGDDTYIGDNTYSGDNVHSGANTFSGGNTFSGTQTFTGDVVFSGEVSFPDDGELTISSGSVTPTGVFHTIDTESDAASDDLVTISGGVDGERLFLRIEDNARVVTINETGNIVTSTGAEIVLDSTSKSVGLVYDSALTKWVVTSAPTVTGITEGTEQATTSGSTIDLSTSIPSGVKRITVMFEDCGLSGSDDLLIQIGDSGGFETSGYNSKSTISATGVAISSSTSGFVIATSDVAGTAVTGFITLNRMSSSSNKWVAGGTLNNHNGNNVFDMSGSKSLTAELDRIRLATSGSNTFDEGNVNYSYE